MYNITMDLDSIITLSLEQPIGLSDIKLYQPYRIVSPANMIDDTGRQKIVDFIASVNLRDPKWENVLPEGYDPYDWNSGFTKHLPPMPDDWCWKNTVENKKIEADAKYGTGKFAKRYRAFVLKTINLALPPKFVEELGQIAGRYSDQSTGSVLRFVHKFDWEAGDFGDPTSCFWGGRESAREMLQSNGAWAVQLFRPESIATGKPMGYGRAWVVPDYPVDGVMTMFNGYGAELGEPSRTIARLLSNMVGQNKYEQIRLLNKDSEGGTLYINSGRGFVIGDLKGARLNETYDLDWPEQILGECRHCSETIYRDDDDYSSYNDHLYCESCADEYLHHDDIANETYDTEYDGSNEVQLVGWGGRTITGYVSDDTLQRHATLCDGCSNHFVHSLVTHVETAGVDYCASCYSENTFVCEECSTVHSIDDVNERTDITDTDIQFCPVCVEDWDLDHTDLSEEELDVDEISA